VRPVSRSLVAAVERAEWRASQWSSAAGDEQRRSLAAQSVSAAESMLVCLPRTQHIVIRDGALSDLIERVDRAGQADAAQAIAVWHRVQPQQLLTLMPNRHAQPIAPVSQQMSIAETASSSTHSSAAAALRESSVASVPAAEASSSLSSAEAETRSDDDSDNESESENEHDSENDDEIDRDSSHRGTLAVLNSSVHSALRIGVVRATLTRLRSLSAHDFFDYTGSTNFIRELQHLPALEHLCVASSKRQVMRVDLLPPQLRTIEIYG
jgi:hypothetical protein